MGFLLNSLLPYVLLYKYVAIFVITFLGAIALPLPSGSVLMAAAFFATQGYMNFYFVLLTGVAGNMAGDSSGYWISRGYGRRFLSKISLFKRILDSDSFKYVETQISRHPFVTVFLSRSMTSVAPAVNILAGFGKMKYLVYLLFEGLGEVAEVSVFCLIGYFFGKNWQQFDQLGGKFWIVILSGIVFSFFFWKFLTRKKDHPKDAKQAH